MNASKFHRKSVRTGLALVSAPLLLAACASYSGAGLKPGKADLAQVEALMGKPAMRWHNADGSTQLAYPRGPAGVDTYMVEIGADGRLKSITDALEPKNLWRIKPGMTKAQVLRIAGPQTCGPSYFWRLNELAWEWHYVDDLKENANFVVLFDGKTGKVRSTMSLTTHKFCL